MNIKFKQMVLTTIVFAGLLSSCKKSETVGYSESAEIAIDSSAITADSVSMAATQNIKDKQFIKTANVNMEVKNVYESTISIENYLKQNGMSTDITKNMLKHCEGSIGKAIIKANR